MKHNAKKSLASDQHPLQIQELRQEIATIAARFIAEDGATYAIAKQRAAQQVLGATKFSHDFLPDNTQLEEQVHVYNQLFFADTQPARLLLLRKVALLVMQDLAQFNPHLVGSVLHGSAGEHDDIVIHLFVDNTKEVAIYLLNRHIEFEVTESPWQAGQHTARRDDPLETLSFVRDNEGVHLVLFGLDDMRRLSVKKSPRASIDALQKIILESETHEV